MEQARLAAREAKATRATWARRWPAIRDYAVTFGLVVVWLEGGLDLIYRLILIAVFLMIPDRRNA